MRHRYSVQNQGSRIYLNGGLDDKGFRKQEMFSLFFSTAALIREMEEYRSESPRGEVHDDVLGSHTPVGLVMLGHKTGENGQEQALNRLDRGDKGTGWGTS